MPDPEWIEVVSSYEERMLHYYYFAPEQIRLMRAWKKTDSLSNNQSGGHRLSGELWLAPDLFILRHYICLTQTHIIRKYSQRKFSNEDLAKGWHNNRLNLTSNRLTLPHFARLQSLPDWQSKAFNKKKPFRQHYWDWQAD